MKRVASGTVLAAAVLAIVGCDGAAESGEPVEVVRVEGSSPDSVLLPAQELRQARETAAALGQDLAGLVFATLEREGPATAVRVCSEVAQERTASHAREGIQVRRVSDRLRNPLNATDPAEARELARMHAVAAAGGAPPEIARIVRDGADRTLHLMRPIVIQPPCLTCHGDPASIPAEVQSILAERYPDDQAVGYEAGDLRGAISVRVPIRDPAR